MQGISKVEGGRMKEDELDVLEMLIRHELAIKQLYEIFAATFANRRDFWQSLASDEQRHADWLGALRSKPAIDKRLLQDSQIRPQAIKLSIGYVESQIVRAQEGKFSLLQALSVARDLESALLEKHFPKLSGSVGKETESILTDLAAETERHRKAVLDLLDIEKRQIL